MCKKIQKIDTKLVEKIFNVLTKRKFNKCKPKRPLEIHKIIEGSVISNEPIKMVGLWGFGDKEKVTEADIICCEWLNLFNNDVKKEFLPGIKWHFIFATKHAEMNGIKKEKIASYKKDVIKIFNKYGITFSNIVKYWDKFDIDFVRIGQYVNKLSDDEWQQLPNYYIFEKNAVKVNKNHDYKKLAKSYFIMRTLEKKVLENEFNGYIYNSFSNILLDNILPDMPRLFLYARKGWSNAPWFVY